MPSTYSKNLGLELMATGEQPGTWGETTNINLQALDDSINGIASQAIGEGALTITIDRAPAMSQGRSKIFAFTGAPIAATTVTFAPNDAEIYYFVRNESSQPITFQQGSGSSYVLAAGYSAVIHCNGGGSAASVFGTLSSIQCNRLLVRADPALPAPFGSGDAAIGGTLNVTGVTTLSGGVAITGSLSVPGNLTVTGTSTLSGAVACNAGLTVTAGGANITGNVGVTGGVAATGALSGASVTSGGTLTVGGHAALNSTAAVAGVLSANGNLVINCGGDAAWDMYTRGVASNLNRIAIGSAGQYLRVSAGSTPLWLPLDIPVGTPVSGASQGQVLFVWDNKIAVAPGFLVGNAPATFVTMKGPNGVTLQLESEAVDQTNRLRYTQGGQVRWDFMMRTIGHGEGTWCLVRYPSGAVNFEVLRENGRVLLGRIDGSNVGGTVNIQSTTGETALVIRRFPGGTGNLIEWQNDAGGVMSYIDKDGVYRSPQAGGLIQMTRTSTHYIATGVTGGAIFFFHPSPQSATPGGFLTFGYGVGTNYGSFYAQLPTEGGIPGPIGGLTWAYRGNSQPPLAYSTFEEFVRFNDESLFARLLDYPDLMERLKERLAA